MEMSNILIPHLKCDYKIILEKKLKYCYTLFYKMLSQKPDIAKYYHYSHSV